MVPTGPKHTSQQPINGALPRLQGEPATPIPHDSLGPSAAQCAAPVAHDPHVVLRRSASCHAQLAEYLRQEADDGRENAVLWQTLAIPQYSYDACSKGMGSRTRNWNLLPKCDPPACENEPHSSALVHFVVYLFTTSILGYPRCVWLLGCTLHSPSPRSRFHQTH